MTPPPMLTRALAYLDAGYSVQWCYRRSKHPIGEGWATRPTWTPDELRAAYRPGHNVSIRCGHWSTPQPDHGLVVVDIDVKDPDAHCEPFEYLGRFYQGPIVQVCSGSGLGQHWYFACPLAHLPAKANTLLTKGSRTIVVDGRTVPEWSIELLSTGKHVVAPPSIHPGGGRYDWMTSLDAVPPLPPDILAAIPAEERTAPQERPPYRATSDSIADQFNASASWAAILEPHGWQYVRRHGERDYWCRPGKHPRDGISASTLGDVFYCFSSSTSFEPCKGYSKFGAYAVLVHGGDQQQAAKRLYAVRAGRAA